MSAKFKILILGLMIGAVLLRSECLARTMSVVESRPAVDEIMDGRATSFSIRFDGPIDHAASRLTLITAHGRRILRPRLESEPNTLFTEVGALPRGGYELHWEARSMDGEMSKGSIPFKVK